PPPRTHLTQPVPGLPALPSPRGLCLRRTRPPPRSTLFPYTTLFRSSSASGTGFGQLSPRLSHPAARELVSLDGQELRLLLAALLDRKRAAGVELAAWGQLEHVRRRPFDRPERLPALVVEPRDRVQQRPGVGMLRMREDI